MRVIEGSRGKVNKQFSGNEYFLLARRFEPLHMPDFSRLKFLKEEPGSQIWMESYCPTLTAGFNTNPTPTT